MGRDRIHLPGLPRDAARVLIAEIEALKDEQARIRRKAGRAGIVTSDYSAKPGEFVNVEPRSGTLVTITLPESTPALRGARITLAFRNSNDVRIVAVQGTVNGEAFVINDRPGTYDATADGLGGWFVQVGVSEEGSGAGGGGGSGGGGGPGGASDSVTFFLTLSGSLTDYDLANECPGIKNGDKVAVTLDGNLTINSIIPPFDGFWCWWGIRDIDGGDWRMTFKDNVAGTTGLPFRTPGAPESTDAGPDFIMSTGEDWTAFGHTEAPPEGGTGGWRILCKNSANTNGLSTVGGPGIPARFDLTHSPVALYHFNQDLSDVSGNGFTLTAAGTARYIELFPNVCGLSSSGAGPYSRASFDAALGITGDITVQMLVRFFSTPTTSDFVAFTASGETSATNTRWLLGWTATNTLRWLHEHDTGATGTDAAFTSTGVRDLPPVRDVYHVAAVRASNVITFYVNGVQLGASSGTLIAPAGGGSSVLSLAANTFGCMGLKIVASALSAAEIKAEYNRTMGVAFGTLA